MSTHVVYKHVVYKHVPGSVPVNRGNWPPPEEACTKKACIFCRNWYMLIEELASAGRGMY